ncbi:MAG TPA: Gfo/Idh/MocA family oxidoreductase [Opitutaceae bacterium]
MSPAPTMKRRQFLKTLAAASITAPLLTDRLLAAQAERVLRHASFGAAGMAWVDVQNLMGSPHVKLVAIAEVDLNRIGELKAAYPDVRVYQDWRELLRREHRNIDSVNVSTPDHMHAPMAMAAMRRGKHVYVQKPLAHDIHEVRALTQYARRKGLVTQMGIQVHSEIVYRQAVRLVQEGAIGRVREVHVWSNKEWGDAGAPPEPSGPVPEGFDWDLWQGGCAMRPFVGDNYYHPETWRKRLDFGTGTFGDMGCHIFDPVFEALALKAPLSVRSEGPSPDAWNWANHARIHYVFPGTRFTEGDSVPVSWYDGTQRPPEGIQALVLNDEPNLRVSDDGKRGPGVPEQGSILVGTEGTMLIPHATTPRLFPLAKFKDHPMPKLEPRNHWDQWVEACLGRGKTSAGFDYSGPLTEAVLLGSVAVRFPGQTLDWNAKKRKFPNMPAANAYVRRAYRKGWKVRGL